MNNFNNLNWDEVEAEKVIHVIDPHPSHRAPEIDLSGIPFPGIGDIDENGDVDFTSCRMVPARIADEHARRYIVEDGDIGFGRVASIGKVIKLKKQSYRYAISPTMAVLKPYAIDSSYMVHFLQSQYIKYQIDRLLTGSTRSSLGIELLRKIMVPVPEPKEQKAIATVLDTVDEAIQSTQAMLDKQDKIKQGLLHDLLTRGVDERGHLRPAPKTAPDLYQQTEIGLIPKGWEVKEIPAAAIEIIDGDRGSNYPSQNDFLKDGYCVFLNTSNVTKHGFNFDAVDFILKGKDQKLRKGKLERFDIVITTRGTVGNIAFFDETVPFDNVRINSGMIILRNNEKGLNTRFLYYSYKDYLFSKEYQKVVSGSAQPQLPIRDMQKFNVLKPSEHEQEKIISLIEAHNLSHNTCANDLQKLMCLKSGLMQDLLTGRRRVQVKKMKEAA